ncbi:MAG: hypothetical protein PQJ50_18615, partial [Spirochaetales bacterium]|nr:hypothetical protein [Spirochaetales bacterium]
MIVRTLGTAHRVFHLGPECYILYLGSDREDDDPFIRIGNCTDLPEVVHKITSKIVLTSSYTGNPFLEVEYARHHKLSYLGDVDIIEHFRKFFQGLQLPARELNDYRQVESRENRHTLYFYNNGNIHLNFDNNLLFDLHKKEAEDLHSNQKCDRIKALLLKNPLRYTREELNKPGFFVSENGKFYLIHRNWIALDLEDQYFSSLASQGIDPDEVHSVFTHLSEDEMGNSEREALVQLIKRRALRKQEITVWTTRMDITDHLLHLFPDDQNTTAVRPVLMEAEKPVTERGMSAVVKEKTLSVEFGESQSLIVPHSSSGQGIPRWAGWHISYDRKVLTHRTEEGVETELQTLGGFPLILEKGSPRGTTLVNRYLSFLHASLEAWEGRDSWKVLYELEELVQSILGGAEAKAPAGLGRLSSKTPGLEYIFLHNAMVILEHYGKKSSEPLVEELSKLLGGMEEPDPVMPVLGDLYSGNKGPFILYRVSSSKLNPFNVRKAREIHSEMEKLNKPDLKLFQEEKQRLQDLLANLYGTGSGVGSRPLPSSTPAKTTAAASTSAATKTDTAPKNKEPERQYGGFDQKPVRKKPPAKSGGSKILWIILILLLLGLLGVGAWFLFSGSGGGASDGDGGAVSTSGSGGGTTADSDSGGGSTAGGSTADGSTADGSSADGSTAGGSTAGGSTADGSTADGSTADGSTADGSTADGSSADGSTADGSTADGSTADGSSADGSTADGSSADGSSADGSSAGGSTADGSTADGSTADG